jgi:predicted alpha-1,2-mannosidase
MVGDGVRDPVHFWQPRAAVLKPYLFDAIVAPYNIRIELTPTDHAAYLRVTFPASGDLGSKRICFSDLQWDNNGNSLSGGGYSFDAHSNNVHSERFIVNNFAFRVRAESKEATQVERVQDMLCFKYQREATVVTVRLGTSLITAKQAELNLNREIPKDKSFEYILQESKDVWHQMMSRVNVLDAGDIGDMAEKHLTIFYTGLYRALTFPRRLDEIDAQGNVVHYSPYDPQGGVHPGYLVTDNGFWDTYRTVYPLLSLAYPDHLGPIVQGWLNAYKEGGWLPSWASPGYRNCMVGTFADVVIADAIVKNVPGFDRHLAFQALSKDAFEGAPRYGGVGKEGLNEYIRLGYLPTEGGGEVVSRTLDYGFADYSTALAFNHLAQRNPDMVSMQSELQEKAERLLDRAFRAVEKSFDHSMGLMVPKDRNGRRSGRFSPVEWGNGFTEGNSWHHSFPGFAVSCSIEEGFGACKSQGLMHLHGSASNLLKKMHDMITMPSHFQVGSYGQEIHEMTEMRAFAMGQYGHNNQPVHHILYLFNLAGELGATQELVREVLDRGYGIDFYAGDEDNGEMGAWYVLSSLGMFAVTPGSDKYVLGSPSFRHVRIMRRSSHGLYNLFAQTNAHLDPAIISSTKTQNKDDEWLDIIALGNDNKVRKSSKILWNKNALSAEHGAMILRDAPVQGHGLLQFLMSDSLDTSDEARALREAEVLHGLSSQEIEDLHEQRYLSDVLRASSISSSSSSSNHKKSSTDSKQAVESMTGHEVHNHHGKSNADMLKRLRAAEEYEKEQAAQHRGSLISPILQIYILMFVACLLACIASEILRTLVKQERLVLDCIKDPVETTQKVSQLFRSVNWRPKHLNHTV